MVLLALVAVEKVVGRLPSTRDDVGGVGGYFELFQAVGTLFLLAAVVVFGV